MFLSLYEKCPIQSFSGPYFPAFNPKTEKHGLDKTPDSDSFHAVYVTYIFHKLFRFTSPISFFVIWVTEKKSNWEDEVISDYVDLSQPD